MSDSTPPSGPRERDDEHVRVRFTLEVELAVPRGSGPMRALTTDAMHAALRGLAVPSARIEGWTLRTVSEQTEETLEDTLRASTG